MINYLQPRKQYNVLNAIRIIHIALANLAVQLVKHYTNVTIAKNRLIILSAINNVVINIFITAHLLLLYFKIKSAACTFNHFAARDNY